MNSNHLKHTRKALEAWEGGACNIRALANALKSFIDDNQDLDSNSLNSHPATRLFLAQMSFLAGIGIGDCNNADSEARQLLEKV